MFKPLSAAAFSLALGEPAFAAEPTNCVVSDSAGVALEAYVDRLQIESRKVQRPGRWIQGEAACVPGGAQLRLSSPNEGALLVASGQWVALSVQVPPDRAAQAMARAAVERLAETADGVGGPVPLLSPSEDISVGSLRPNEPARPWTLAAGLRLTGQEYFGYLGPFVAGQRRFGRGHVVLSIEAGVGVPDWSVAVDEGVGTEPALAPHRSAFWAQAAARVGGRVGPVWLRVGLGAGPRWQEAVLYDIANPEWPAREGAVNPESEWSEFDPTLVYVGPSSAAQVGLQAEAAVDVSQRLALSFVCGPQYYRGFGRRGLPVGIEGFPFWGPKAGFIGQLSVGMRL